MRKKEGHAVVYMSIGILAFAFVSFIAAIVLTLQKSNMQSQKVDNVLKQATLAAAVYDTKQYGTDHSIVITDISTSYNEFLKSLRESMYLDDNMNSLDKGYTKGSVRVEKFIIYNVKGSDVEVITKGDIGESRVLYRNQKDAIKTPNNIVVDKTMIYSKITFTVNVLGEDIEDASKDVTIGVVNS